MKIARTLSLVAVSLGLVVLAAGTGITLYSLSKRRREEAEMYDDEYDGDETYTDTPDEAANNDDNTIDPNDPETALENADDKTIDPDSLDGNYEEEYVEDPNEVAISIPQ